MIFNILTTGIGIGLGLGLMVLVHEWGHFVVAKAFGVRVDVFSIGFGPRLFGVKRGTTDYRVSALPLGGYVRMAGDNTFEERKKEPDELLSKPRWQRVLIALAGPAMNILTAVVIIAGVSMLGNEEPAYLSQPIQIAGIFANSAAADAGFQPGDRIVQLDGVQNPTWERLRLSLALALPGSTLQATVERNGSLVSIKIPAGGDDEIHAAGYPSLPRIVVGPVSPGGPAERAGLKAGDQILALNGGSISDPAQLVSELQANGDHAVQVLIDRGGQQQVIEVHPALGPSAAGGEKWQFGIQIGAEFPTVLRHYSFAGAVGHSIELNALMANQILHVVANLFRAKGALLKQIEGPLGIIQATGEAARNGFRDLLALMAMISLNLAVINLLPIGPLDGGHIILLVIEGGIRRDLSLRVKERFVTVSVVFLLLIIGVATYNDVLRLFPHH